jgi:Glycosyltransferase family 87
LRQGFFLVLLLALLGEFTVRGPMRALRTAHQLNDFTSPYVQTFTWLEGKNPYDLQVLAKAWPTKESNLLETLSQRGVPSPYPITGFPLLAPFAAFPWSTADYMWLATQVLSAALFSVSLLALVDIFFPMSSGRWVLVMVLAFAPLHTGIAVGNVSTVALALATAGLVCVEKKRELLAAVLLAAAFSLKPTIAMPAVIYVVVDRRWLVCIMTAAVSFLLFAAAQMRMILTQTEWINSYLVANRQLSLPGAVYDFSNANPTRFDLLNSQVLLSQFLDRRWAQCAAMLLAITATAAWLFFRHKVQVPDKLLDLSIASAIILVPFYHRFYDATLLIFPVAWSVANLKLGTSRNARLTLAASTAFLVPGAAILRTLAANNATLAQLSRTWWWDLSIASHQIWAVLFMLTVLLLAQRKLARTNDSANLAATGVSGKSWRELAASLGP